MTDGDGAPPSTGRPPLSQRVTATMLGVQRQSAALLDRHRRRPLVDLALRIYDRDRLAVGSVVGSALAFRLFLFFVPLVLFAVGIAGFFADVVGLDDVEDAGISGTLALQIDSALRQASSTRWIAVAAGMFGMVTAGRTLSKVMTQASCLSWGLPMRSKASVRLIGTIVGLVVGGALVATLVNRIRHDLGIGAAGISFVAAFIIYVLTWWVLLAALPRPTSDPAPLLPGAVLIAATITGMQAISQLYLPDRFDRASQLYGALGVTVVTLGWFFIVGRINVLAMVVNAAVYERFGSIARLVFGLPLVRRLPRRSDWVRRTFELDDDRSTTGAVERPAAEGDSSAALRSAEAARTDTERGVR